MIPEKKLTSFIIFFVLLKMGCRINGLSHEARAVGGGGLISSKFQNGSKVRAYIPTYTTVVVIKASFV